MLHRLLLGLLKGALVGGGLGAIVVFGLGLTTLTGFLAYATAITAGVIVALVAGKPIWTKGAWVEVLLKAVAAAPVAAGLVFALGHLLRSTLSLGSFGNGTPSQLPLVILPLVATLLAIFFEIDNTSDNDTAGPRRRVSSSPARTRLQQAADEEEVLDSAERRRAERR